MSIARRFASALLGVVTRRLSPESRGWGQAMLRELDFVESDWAAFAWALGSTVALCRYSGPRQIRRQLEKQFGRGKESTLKTIGQKAAGLLTGVLIAGAFLAVCVIGLVRFHPSLFAGPFSAQAILIEWLILLVIPETAFVIGAISLWQKRRSTAAGLLLAGMILISHVIIHVTTHT